LVGFLVFVALITRLGAMGVAATRRAGLPGWLALGWLTTILLDAVTRESFTGFPTAFLGLLLIGVALAVAAPGRWSGADREGCLRVGVRPAPAAR
jgi:hypothetical protein